jgi:RND family efflux transporter MFP subunit
MAVVAVSPVNAGGDLSCVVKPRVVVAVGSPIPGLLTQLSVDQGDLVKEGQVLANIESSLEQAEVDVAKAKVEMEAAITSTQVKAEFSRRKAGRARNLTSSSAIASNEFDEAETEQRVTEAAHLEALENKVLAQRQLARAEAALALRTIRSPITGVVIERYVAPGELVKDKPILQIAQLDPLQVEVFAPMSLLGKFTVGMPIDLKMDHTKPGMHRAHVSVINPIVDSASGTFRVRLELPNPQYRIPAGVTCTARIAPQ